MTVVIISEENHGFIGVAKDLPSAFLFLITEGWVDDLYDDDKGKYVYHTELFEKYKVNDLYSLMIAMYAENEDCFDGMFYFNICKVFEKTT